jgi:hypothetical protein
VTGFAVTTSTLARRDWGRLRCDIHHAIGPDSLSRYPDCKLWSVTVTSFSLQLEWDWKRQMLPFEDIRFSSLRCSICDHRILEEIPTVTSALFVPTGCISSPRIGGGAFRSSFDIRSRSCSNRKLCEAVSSPDVFPVSALLVLFAYLWRHGTKLRKLTIKKVTSAYNATVSVIFKTFVNSQHL